MSEERTAADLARTIADAFERHDIPYAIGGALALAFYAPPRATVDVDVNVFVDIASGLESSLDVLESIGFVADRARPAVIEAAVDSGQIRGHIGSMRVDVFVPAVPYYGELQERRQSVLLLGRPLWILGPEDLAILKLMFFRRKDLADVEAMLRDQGTSLDRTFIRRRLVEFVGEDDERVAALSAIERDVFDV